MRWSFGRCVFEEGTTAVYCVPHATPHYQIVDLESISFRCVDFLKDRPTTFLTFSREDQIIRNLQP